MCLSNHKQLIIAWGSYINDYDMFPYGEEGSTFRTNEAWGWGGVDWYPETISAPNNIPRMRPLNAYIGSESRITAKLDVFRCPLDNGTREYGTGVNNLAIQAASSLCPEPNTIYGTSGTSYRSNTWIYCKPGAIGGWGGFPTYPNYRSKQGPHDVRVAASRFVLLHDTGPSNWFVSTTAQLTPTIAGEWWHGRGQGVLSFLDGSARREKAALNVSSRYSMHMIPIPNPNSGWRWPDRP